MTGICCEKCVLAQFDPCANIIECAYTDIDDIAYSTPGPNGIVYCF